MKKIIIPIIGGIVILCASFVLYCYLNPKILINRGFSLNSEKYTEQATVVIFASFPLTERKNQEIIEFAQKNDEIFLDLYHNYIAPCDVKVSGDIKNGKTYIRYSGTATAKDGTEKIYDKELVFDFVLTSKKNMELPTLE